MATMNSRRDVHPDQEMIRSSRSIINAFDIAASTDLIAKTLPNRPINRVRSNSEFVRLLISACNREL